MKSSFFLYSEPSQINKLQILTSIFFVGMLLIVLVSFQLFKIVPAWLITAIFSLTFVSTLFYFKFKINYILCEVTKTPSGLLIELMNTNFLYKKKEVILYQASIKQITEDKDFANYNRSYFIIIPNNNQNKIKLTQTKKMLNQELDDFFY